MEESAGAKRARIEAAPAVAERLLEDVVEGHRLHRDAQRIELLSRPELLDDSLERVEHADPELTPRVHPRRVFQDQARRRICA
jgi:hypothetical protein